SAPLRDKLLKERKAIAFEMEGAGAWDNFPTVVIKSVCDYADSHKNNIWQSYAAATAAACMKAFLKEWRRVDRPQSLHQSPLTGLPVTGHFVNRDAEMEQMEENLLPTKARYGQEIHILHGLGGIGKTQLAIAYARKHQHRYSATVWVNGNSRDTVLQSLAAFARHAGIRGGSEPTDRTARQAPDMKADTDAVLRWLTIGKNGRWLMVFDNVDGDVRSDQEDTQAYSVISFLPAADHGSVLVTTRLSSMGEMGESTEVTRLRLDQALELLSDRSDLHRSSSGTRGFPFERDSTS
ncbi:MAG: hypothetical protein Q9179_007951, partial [Wetmoreana sp. 5 TL-2023]